VAVEFITGPLLEAPYSVVRAVPDRRIKACGHRSGHPAPLVRPPPLAGPWRPQDRRPDVRASYAYLTIIFPNEPWCLLQVIGHRCRFWVIPPRLFPHNSVILRPFGPGRALAYRPDRVLLPFPARRSLPAEDRVSQHPVFIPVLAADAIEVLTNGARCLQGRRHRARHAAYRTCASART